MLCPSPDITSVPSQKMPTIQLYKSGEKVAEHIAAEGAIDALEKVCRSWREAEKASSPKVIALVTTRAAAGVNDGHFLTAVIANWSVCELRLRSQTSTADQADDHGEHGAAG